MLRRRAIERGIHEFAGTCRVVGRDLTLAVNVSIAPLHDPSLAARTAAALRAVAATTFDAPQGPVRIEPANRHAHLTPRIGLSSAAGGFRVIYEAPRAVAPDPYLVWHEPRELAQPRRQPPSLRIVR